MNKPLTFGKIISLYQGDCMEVLRTMEANSIDAVVTDPPYHLVSIVKRFSNATKDDVYKNAELRKTFNQGTSPFARAAKGFMGKKWDGGDIAFRPETWAEVLRVMKPGAHMLAFGGTRTHHRMVCAIEDAGFEIRDSLCWLYGTGFPKSHDVSKGIDKAAGAKREIVGRKTGRAATPVQDMRSGSYAGGHGKNSAMDCSAITAPATDAARQWEGWGTALKPAFEPIVLARKPLSEGTVAANVLRWGTGAINIDDCRVAVDADDNNKRRATAEDYSGPNGMFIGSSKRPATLAIGRWPANVMHDGSDEVVAAFPVLGKSAGGRIGNAGGGTVLNIPTGKYEKGNPGFGDSGSAARLFYTAKATKADRAWSNHPTVKPVKLLRYLIKLITPPNGVVLDPFAGTGTTGEAAFLEGKCTKLIEREYDYHKVICERMTKAVNKPSLFVDRKSTDPEKRYRQIGFLNARPTKR